MTPILQLFLLLAIIISCSKISGHLVQRYLRQPVVLGEILAGLLLGPTLFNIFGWPLFYTSDGTSHFLRQTVEVLAEFGVLLLLFVAGLETNLSQMRRVGKSAFVTALCGVLVPLGMGLLTARLFGIPFAAALFIGVVLTATSVSITAQTLTELRQMQSKEGTTILGGAVIDDVLGIIILSFVLAFLQPSSHDTHVSLVSLFGASGGTEVMLTVIGIVLFFVIAVALGRYAIPAVLRAADRMHASHAVATAALLLVLLFSVGAEFIGQLAAITGAYLAGVFLTRTPYHRKIERSIHPFTYAFFVPIFFMSIGLDANARTLAGGSIVFVVVIILAAILSKVCGCWLGARVTGNTGLQSLRIGIGMVSRGEVGLIIAKIGMDSGLLTPPIFAAMVLMVLVTTLVTPVLLRFSFPPVPPMAVEVYESVVTIEADDDREPQ